MQSLQDRFFQETSKRHSSRSRGNSTITSQSEDGAIDMADTVDDNATLATGVISLPGTNGDYISTGHYVTIEISNLSLSAVHQKLHEMESSGYLCLFSLLQHEFKLSVLHFTVQRSGDVERVIKSKDQLIFEVYSYSLLSSHLHCRLHFDNLRAKQYLASQTSIVISIKWKDFLRFVVDLLICMNYL